MALKDSLEQLQNFDFNDLDINTIGVWPTPIKIIVAVLLFIGLMAGGYFGYLTEKLQSLELEQRREVELKSSFETKAGQASILDELRQQKVEMEESFGALLRQLPTDTEVPGLLEDISNTGLQADLQFDQIVLQPERRQEFYIELPIEITVEGTYHNLGAFVSGVANLSRIVTLHDFRITPAAEGGGKAATVIGADGRLRMDIQARTYRYMDEEAD